MSTKINQLTKLWKPGFVFTSTFLKENAIYYDQQRRYKNSGWLESLGSGAFKRSDDSVSWPGALHAMQKQLNLKIHLSGKSALLQHGVSHYLQAEERHLYLNMYRYTKIPKWFKNTCQEIILLVSQTSFLDYDVPDSYTTKNIDGFEIKLSTPERAAFEMLFYVPAKQGFDEAFKLMEFLTTLRPDKVELLLKACHSVKVKRLFLYMADKLNHSWFNEIDSSKVQLGSGKRVIVKNGELDKKYLITVPGEMGF